MRSDAYPLIAASPALVALKEGDGQFDLLPPNLREIGQIIRFPATAAGLRFEARQTGERLDDVIRDDAAKNPGALPLLQFLLEELYERRTDEDVLTFRAYEDLGGVEGALAQRAEAVFESVGDDARRALPTVLRELVTLGGDDGSKALRRIAPRSAFMTSAAIELVDALLDARLLVSTLDDRGDAAISLAHEALLEFWPRVRAWRDDDRELLLVHARVAAAARAWEQEGRNADLLLARGKPLAEAKGLVAADVRLDASEAALLAQSDRRARRFSRVRSGAIAGLAVLAVVAGIAAWKANVESGRARVQATTAQRTTDFMVGLFANADPTASQGKEVTVREVLDKGVKQLDQELLNESSVRSNLLRAMGQAYTGLGTYDMASKVLQQSIDQSQQSADPNDRLKANTAMAWNKLQAGEYEEATRGYREALPEARQLHGAVSSEVAQILSGLAESLAEQGQFAEAQTTFERALSMQVAVYGDKSSQTALTLDAYGRLLYGHGDYEAAESRLNASLAMFEAIDGPEHSDVAMSLNNLASLQFQEGHYEAARNTWNKALPILRSVFGPNYRLVADALNNLGRVELLTGDLNEARKNLVQAIAIERSALSPSHEDLILPLNSLAMVLVAQGDAVSAKPLLAEALRIARAHNHWMLGQVLANEADIAIDDGNLTRATDCLDEARTLLVAQYGGKLRGNEAWRASILDVTQAAIDAGSHRNDDAKRRLTASLPVLTNRFGPDGLYPMRVKAALSRLPPAMDGAIASGADAHR